jgi:hypothetical protein
MAPKLGKPPPHNCSSTRSNRIKSRKMALLTKAKIWINNSICKTTVFLNCSRPRPSCHTPISHASVILKAKTSIWDCHTFRIIEENHCFQTIQGDYQLWTRTCSHQGLFNQIMVSLATQISATDPTVFNLAWYWILLTSSKSSISLKNILPTRIYKINRAGLDRGQTRVNLARKISSRHTHLKAQSSVSQICLIMVIKITT